MALAHTCSGTTWVYVIVTAYNGVPIPVLQTFDAGNSTTDAVTNVAPYWRVAIEPHWGPHYLMVGTFGMYGQMAPGRVYGFGTTITSTSDLTSNTNMTAINTA